MGQARYLGEPVNARSAQSEGRREPATLRSLGLGAAGLLCATILLLASSPRALADPASPPEASAEIAREWSLTGILIAGPEERLAVLENRLRRQQAVVRLGGAILPGVTVEWIGVDRVVLEVHGEPVTLRLGHSGEARPAPRVSRAPGTSPNVLQRLSERLGVPVSTLERQRREGNLTWQRLWLAHRLAQRTGLSVEQVLGAFRAGRGWRALAWEHQVPVGELLRELTELRRALMGSRP